MSNQTTIAFIPSDLLAAWNASEALNPGVTLDIDGGDHGGWYLTWDHADWDSSYPLDADRPVETLDPWSALVWPLLAKQWATRAGHLALGGDDGAGYDNGERTFSWQTLDILITTLTQVLPPEVLADVTGRWVKLQADRMRWAMERAVAPVVEITDPVVVPSGRERLGLVEL